MLAFLFPGQGSQFSGMGKSLAQQFPLARRVFEEADEVLGRRVSDACFGNAEDLDLTVNAQPAILAASVAAYRVLTEETGLHPTVVAGHSLGEISALTCVGAIDFATALELVHVRATVMQDAVAPSEGAMLAVMALPLEEVNAICDRAREGDVLEISNYNGFHQFVVSGHRDAVARAEAMAIDAGGVARPLEVSAPFHCSLMESAAAAMGEYLSRVEFRQPAIPFLDMASGRILRDSESTGLRLARQVRTPVRWDAVMHTLVSLQIDRCIEVGPGRGLCSLLRHDAPQIAALAFGEADDLGPILSALSEAPTAARPLGHWQLDSHGNSFNAAEMAVVWAGQQHAEGVDGTRWIPGTTGSWMRRFGHLAVVTPERTLEVLDPEHWFARADGAFVRRDLSCIMLPDGSIEHLVPDEWSISDEAVMTRKDGTRTLWPDGLEWRFDN
jgi:malonyl CoA-acyl carrier protein transacylase